MPFCFNWQQVWSGNQEPTSADAHLRPRKIIQDSMEKVQPFSQYEANHPLPELSHILLSSESFCSTDLQENSPHFAFSTSTSHIINQGEETPCIDVCTTLLGNMKNDKKYMQLKGVHDVNLNEPSNSTTEEEFLYQLNLSKCNKSPTPCAATKKPNTRHITKLKCAKRNGVKVSPSQPVGKTKKSKAVHLKEKISRLKTANARQKTLTKKIKEKLKSSEVSRKLPADPTQSVGVDGAKSSKTQEAIVSGICRPCQYAYSSVEEKEKHFNDHKHIVVVECKKGTNFQALEDEASVFGDVQFPAKCTVCGESFEKKREFLVHHRRHAAMRPFHCIRCTAKFYRRCDLLSHIRDHLGENLRFPCKECSGAFRNKASLNSHLIAKHGHADMRSRNYKCTECSVAFMSKEAVDRHMKTHTGYSVVNCPICCRGFANKFTLQCHQRVHSGEMPYKCDRCSYESKTKQLLVRHQRSHDGYKPFKCDTCSFACTSNSGLKRHMVQHTGTKPFKCPYCTYRSSNIENLRKHIKKTKKHVGLNIYRCQHCMFSSDESTDYIRHVKQQHFPALDEDTASATKLSGIVASETETSHNQTGNVPLQTVTSLPAPTLPSVRTVLDPLPSMHGIDMLLVSDTGASADIPGRVSGFGDVSARVVDDFTGATHVSNNMDLASAAVNGLNEDLLNALIKIPNLQRVILPPNDGSTPVTLVIGSDQLSTDVAEDGNLHNPNDDCLKGILDCQLAQTNFQDTNTLSVSSTGHQHYIISSSGIRSYKKT